MGFQVITTYAYSGQPSKGRAKLRIRLQNGTQLIATDEWPHYPRMQLVLHLDHLPQNAKKAVRSLVAELQQRNPDLEINPKDILVLVAQNVRVGDLSVKVQIQYGHWSNPTRILSFDSKVVALDVIS